MKRSRVELEAAAKRIAEYAMRNLILYGDPNGPTTLDQAQTAQMYSETLPITAANVEQQHSGKQR